MTASTHRQAAMADRARSAGHRHAEATRAMGHAPDAKAQFGAAVDYLRSIARLLTPADRMALFKTAARLLVEETGRVSQRITGGGS